MLQFLRNYVTFSHCFSLGRKMKCNSFLLSLGSGRWILAVILAALGIQARAGEAPAPRDQLPQDEAGIAKMMKVTWSHEVLPARSDPLDDPPGGGGRARLLALHPARGRQELPDLQRRHRRHPG